MRPKELGEAWVDAFNRSDPDEMASFYEDDAVNHQVTREPVRGRAAIRDMFTRDFAEADMECIVENIFEDGDWAILEWRDPLGLHGCGFFHIQNDKSYFNVATVINCLFSKSMGLCLESGGNLRMA